MVQPIMHVMQRSLDVLRIDYSSELPSKFVTALFAGLGILCEWPLQTPQSPEQAATRTEKDRFVAGQSILALKAWQIHTLSFLCCWPDTPSKSRILSRIFNVLFISVWGTALWKWYQAYYKEKSEISAFEAHPLVRGAVSALNLLAKAVISVALGVFTEKLFYPEIQRKVPIPSGLLGVVITTALVAVSVHNVYKDWNNASHPHTAEPKN